MTKDKPIYKKLTENDLETVIYMAKGVLKSLIEKHGPHINRKDLHYKYIAEALVTKGFYYREKSKQLSAAGLSLYLTDNNVDGKTFKDIIFGVLDFKTFMADRSTKITLEGKEPPQQDTCAILVTDIDPVPEKTVMISANKIKHIISMPYDDKEKVAAIRVIVMNEEGLL